MAVMAHKEPSESIKMTFLKIFVYLLLPSSYRNEKSLVFPHLFIMTSGVRVGASLSLLTDDIAVTALIVCEKCVLDDLILGSGEGKQNQVALGQFAFFKISHSPQFTLNYNASLIIENNIRNRVCQEYQEV